MRKSITTEGITMKSFISSIALASSLLTVPTGDISKMGFIFIPEELPVGPTYYIQDQILKYDQYLRFQKIYKPQMAHGIHR